MPYVRQEYRNRINSALEGLVELVNSPGELNYVITTLILRSGFLQAMSYVDIALVTGVLENVKQELYRRRFAPYEDEKIKTNGDVF